MLNALHVHALACISQNFRRFFGPESNFSSGGEVFSLKTSAKWLIDLRLYCLAFERNGNLISVGKTNTQ